MINRLRHPVEFEMSTHVICLLLLGKKHASNILFALGLLTFIVTHVTIAILVA